MNYSEAIRALKMERDTTDDIRARNTFSDLLYVMLRADTQKVKRWASDMEGTIAYVKNGNYAGTCDDARRILTRRKPATITSAACWDRK